MTITQIQKRISQALESSNSQGVNIAISIVDNGGNLVGFVSDPKCSYAVIKASYKKAKTYGAFKIPTDIIGKIIESDPKLKAAFDDFKDIFYLGGELPILVDDEIIGGVGIARGNSEQDKLVAQQSILNL